MKWKLCNAIKLYSKRGLHTQTETAITGQHRVLLGDAMSTRALVKGLGSSFGDLTDKNTLQFSRSVICELVPKNNYYLRKSFLFHQFHFHVALPLLKSLFSLPRSQTLSNCLQQTAYHWLQSAHICDFST